MKSKAKQAVVFGIVFSILFTLISFVGPEVIKTTCGDQKQSEYKLLGATLFTRGEIEPSCSGGTVKTGIGYPFSTRVQEGITGPQRVIERDRSGFETQTGAVLGNLTSYFFIGFVLFILFAPRRYSKVNN